MKSRSVRSSVLLACTLLMFAACATLARPARAAQQADWTFGIYMCSDNDLDAWGALNNEWLMSAASSENVNFLVLWDTSTGPASRPVISMR